MRYRIDGFARAVAAAGFLTAAGFGPATAQAPSPSPAQTTPAPAPTGAPPAAAPTVTRPTPPGMASMVEARIADLDKRLAITPAERPQFTAMAETMRANARTMDALLAERQRDTDNSAVDSLRWYQRLTQAHAEALAKFVPSFDALYAVLSANQRKTADALFQQLGQHPSPARPR